MLFALLFVKSAIVKNTVSVTVLFVVHFGCCRWLPEPLHVRVRNRFLVLAGKKKPTNKNDCFLFVKKTMAEIRLMFF